VFEIHVIFDTRYLAAISVHPEMEDSGQSWRWAYRCFLSGEQEVLFREAAHGFLFGV
jgi:hypothetical protein